ncbi:O-Methyltransferase involved in polyketide biosynthesis [Nonomuraea solani]|uniref:O-Methyltransferase involved in polyketide biosynthesis n=1 Tax=Nonomuraea solani TaxID=1144553 RepID=A0A1H6EFX9_9ACTN|nr:class I SAM-dependent methyltransferase [Nonomuraea solani]SEG96728.1 O-Methyltransferase involved in polyketide biosynthesis [Nonomuraea solani]
MNTEKVDFRSITDEGVTWTMLGTLYLRAWESRQARPILGDRHAAEAIDRIDYDFAALKRRLRPESNQFLVALRARQLDDWSTAFLARHPDAAVLHLGCGLDSRMLRLDPDAGLRWYDLDIPQVIDLRRKLYEEQGGYQMIGASVADEGWLEAIPADRPALIIAEGLFPYLAPTEVRRLLQRLTDHFPSGEVIFDASSPWLGRLVKLCRWAPRDGREVERWNPRLKCAEQVPFTTHYHRIPVRRYRVLYRLMHAVPALRHMMREYRFTF